MLKNDMDVINSVKNNREGFQSTLLKEAGDVASKVQLILEQGNIDLLKNAEKITYYVIGGQEEELIDFAKLEGKSWAKNDLTVEFKLKWVHALRRTLWIILRKNNPLESSPTVTSDFFEMEKKINDGIDKFLNNFFMSYTSYKDKLILEQRRLVEHLTVPIIPLSSGVAVLPLIGKFDSYRMDIIEEKVLSEISRLEIDTLIMDLSGTPDIDEYNLARFEKVLSGVAMLGCESILTGLRPNLVKKMAGYGKNYGLEFKVTGTLQQAINELIADKFSITDIHL